MADTIGGSVVNFLVISKQENISGLDAWRLQKADTSTAPIAVAAFSATDQKFLALAWSSL